MSNLSFDAPEAMKSRRHPPSQELRELTSRLIEEGKDWANAEIGVVKATAGAWLRPAKVAMPLAVVAAFLLQAALTVLVAALGMALTPWLGTAGGLAVGGLVALLIVGALAAAAIRQFKGIGE
jgi:hypothetical protein